MKRLAAPLALLLLPAAAGADVRLPSIFADGMVIQRDRRVPVWGTAEPGEAVAVSFAGKRAEAIADAGGRWRVDLDPLSASAEGDLVVAGRTTAVVRGVLVGEVWVCSGQSNMEWAVRSSGNPEAEAAAASRYPRIRLFTVPHAVAGEPRSDAGGKWVTCSPESAATFSAVAFAFGRDLADALGAPIGLIQTTWGGTPAEAWTSPTVLAADPAFAPIVERWTRLLAEFPEATKRHAAERTRWEEAAARAKEEGKPAPAAPPAPPGPEHPHRPGGLWNAMVSPLVPYAIRGAIWYQGESNASRAHQYRTLFPALIRDWRRAWNQGDFPFLFVQLANFKVRGGADGKTWAELRDAQRETLALPNTAMAVTIDIGDPGDIHPKNKREVGRRLALAARARVYGERVLDSGPLYRGIALEGDAVRLRFDAVGEGLVAAGGEALRGFEVAGEDRAFVPAEARIDGETVLARSPAVARPVAVRYAWSDDPPASLFNRAGLPASPFRTDDWPGVTAEAR